MDNTTLAIIVAVVVVAVVVIALLYSRRRRSEELKQRFGPEYDRTVREMGSPTRAEAALDARARKVDDLHIRPLTPEESGRYAEAWRRVQARFVDNPEGAVGEADRLVTDVMHVQGYPMGDFDERAADLSVDHASVVENYRAAHAIALRQERGQVDTEELRQALRHYRALFDDLIEVEEPHPARRS